jgi:hypothetical protein
MGSKRMGSKRMFRAQYDLRLRKRRFPVFG